MFTVPPDALHPGVQADDQSGHSVPTVDVLTVTTLVMLAGRLPGHAKLGGDLRPPDALADGVVDERRNHRLGLLLRNPGAPDPLEHLGRGHPGKLRYRVWRFRWRLLPIRLYPSGSWTRLALRPRHAIHHAHEE